MFNKKMTNLIVILVFLLIWLSGKFLGGFIASSFAVESDLYKQAINTDNPIIYSTYNSGHVDTSLVTDFKNMAKYIFNIDFDSPVSIVSGELSAFSKYYNEDYTKLIDITQEDKSEKEEQKKKVKPKESSVSVEPEREKVAESVSSDIPVINETNYDIDVKKLLNEKLNIKSSSVVIYHTHGTEAYISNVKDVTDSSVSARSHDKSKSVVRVGDQLAKYLKNDYKLKVTHNGTINDYPDFNMSYKNALVTIENVLKGTPESEIVFDVHRDGGSATKKLRVVKDDVSQIMFIVGTDASDLEHPTWRENLKFALKVQKKLNEIYPGITRPVYISYNRYNQHVRKGAVIVEVGGDGNLLSESVKSMKYLAQATYEVLKDEKILN